MGGQLISRDALERIIKRAAELQAAERDIGEGLTKNEVLALGQDVGIPTRYLQQALLEEETRSLVEPERGLWPWLAGPATLGAQRVVPGDKAGVERAVARWLDEEELLQVKRRYPDRTTWEPRGGAFASIQRALAGGRRYALARASEVGVQVTQLEPGFCHVRLEAEVRNLRSARLGGASVMLVVGWAITGAFYGALGAGLLGGTPAAAAAAGAIPGVAMTLGAVGVARSHRRDNARIHLALEQILDRLERGEVRPEHALPGSRGGAFVRIADEIRKTFQL